jgi:hypothetical protein
MTEEEKVEYKNTLNLPQTTLAMRANAAVKELEIQRLKNKIHNELNEKIIKSQQDKTQKKYGFRKFTLIIIIVISIFLINHIIKSKNKENISNISDNIESFDSSNTEDKKIENQLKNIEEKEYPNGDLKF